MGSGGMQDESRARTHGSVGIPEESARARPPRLASSNTADARTIRSLRVIGMRPFVVDGLQATPQLAAGLRTTHTKGHLSAHITVVAPTLRVRYDRDTRQAKGKRGWLWARCRTSDPRSGASVDRQV